MPVPYHLFDVFGIELEYMIVDDETLNVSPVCDRLLHSQAGNDEGEVVFDDISWSNELALHVVELKTSKPSPTLVPLASAFQEHIGRVERLLDPLGARLMPTAMHPWMDPHREMRLWPHDNAEIYAAFDRVFDCRGHGWSNLQSMHINLPFSGDEEFGRLHAAIRLVLPLLPALAASSPAMDGQLTGFMDNRLRVYRNNSARIPSVAGMIIPESVSCESEYNERIYQRMYRDIAPFDPDGVLQQPWLNARGAIARFGRGTIEIRVIDVQECPRADLAIAAATIGLVRAFVEERWAGSGAQNAFDLEPLRQVLWSTTDDAGSATIADTGFLQMLGIGGHSCTANEAWRDVVERLFAMNLLDDSFAGALEFMLQRGSLAERISRAIGPSPSRQRLAGTYARLCDCLSRGEMFDA